MTNNTADMVDLTDEAFEEIDLPSQEDSTSFTDKLRQAMETSGFWDNAETARVNDNTIQRLRDKCVNG